MEWVNPAPAAGIALLRDGKNLLSKRAREPKKGQWDLIGGFLESGEDAATGAAREVLEETGCQVEELVFVRSAPGSYAGRPTLNLLFRGRIEGQPKAADDSAALKWFPLNKVPRIAWPHEARLVRELARAAARRAAGEAEPEAARNGTETKRPIRKPLARMTWPEAAEALRHDTVVVLPLGAAAKEHGPHLPLETDRLLAEALAAELGVDDVVVAPTLTEHHYPAFSEFPGSATLRAETAANLVVDVVRSHARHGPRRFYVLNTGLSTIGPLQRAARVLERDGLKLMWLDWEAALAPVAKRLANQAAGTHADEVETSLMLHWAPDRVAMAAAVRDVAAGPGGFSRARNPSGVFGDATRATAEKGRAFAATLLKAARRDLRRLSHE